MNWRKRADRLNTNTRPCVVTADVICQIILRYFPLVTLQQLAETMYRYSSLGSQHRKHNSIQGENDIQFREPETPYPVPGNISLQPIYGSTLPPAITRLPPADAVYVAQVTDKRIFFTYQPALSLQCYVCSNTPGSVRVPEYCDNVVKRTCDRLTDRCMTMNYSYTFLIFQSVETKNRSSRLACDQQLLFNCKYIRANNFLQVFFPLRMYGPSGIAIISFHVNTIGVTQVRTSFM